MKVSDTRLINYFNKCEKYNYYMYFIGYISVIKKYIIYYNQTCIMGINHMFPY